MIGAGNDAGRPPARDGSRGHEKTPPIGRIGGAKENPGFGRRRGELIPLPASAHPQKPVNWATNSAISLRSKIPLWSKSAAASPATKALTNAEMSARS